MRAEPMVSYRREGGTPPPDAEALDLHADGTYKLWRTIDRASRPPSPVGKFAGRLDESQQSAVRAAVDACAHATPVSITPALGASTDRVTVGSHVSSWGEDQAPPAPWDALRSLLHELIGTLTAEPAAAVDLRRQDTGLSLVRLGADELELDLSGATVRAVSWQDGAAVDQWTAAVGGPWSVVTGPGWTFSLPFGHPFSGIVTAHVDEVLAFDGEFWRGCSVSDQANRDSGG
jgi:hypothetical protein